MRWSSLSAIAGVAVLSCADNDASPPTEPPCSTTRRPIVAVHGFLAAGDTFAKQAQRFAQNGYCLRSLHAFDWNTLGEKSAEENLAELDAFIDEVRAKEKVDKVDLMGHSAGGGLSYNYLSDPTRAAKVAHYAHLGSFRQPDENKEPAPAGPNGEILTLNVYSEADLIVQDKGDIPGATNVKLTEEDHYAVATGSRTFFELYSFFNDGQIPTTLPFLKIPSPPEYKWLSGKALTLGGNEPAVGATIAVFEVSPDSGERQVEVARLSVDSRGQWGPVPAPVRSGGSTRPLEFLVQPKDAGSQPIHYYFEPFTASNHLIRLRTIPNDQSIAGSLLSTINYDDAHSVVIAFVANRGVIAGKDILSINNVNVATERLAPASKNAIAFFAYDANGNGESENTPIGTFSSFPFMSAVDAFYRTTDSDPIPLSLNDSKLKVKRWKSLTEGPIVAVFND